MRLPKKNFPAPSSTAQTSATRSSGRCGYISRRQHIQLFNEFDRLYLRITYFGHRLAVIEDVGKNIINRQPQMMSCNCTSNLQGSDQYALHAYYGFKIEEILFIQQFRIVEQPQSLPLCSRVLTRSLNLEIPHVFYIIAAEIGVLRSSLLCSPCHSL